MRAVYHQPFAIPDENYPYKIEQIGQGLEGAGKYNAFNVLSEKTLGTFDTAEEAQAAVTSECARVNAVAEEYN